jgi:hypothetical protein
VELAEVEGLRFKGRCRSSTYSTTKTLTVNNYFFKVAVRILEAVPRAFTPLRTTSAPGTVEKGGPMAPRITYTGNSANAIAGVKPTEEF